EVVPRSQHERATLAGAEIDKQIVTRIDPDGAHDRLEHRDLDRFIACGVRYVLARCAEGSRVDVDSEGRYPKTPVEALFSQVVVVMLGAEPLFPDEPSNCVDRLCHSYKKSAVQARSPVTQRLDRV